MEEFFEQIHLLEEDHGEGKVDDDYVLNRIHEMVVEKYNAIFIKRLIAEG